jgi:5'-nucleotidase
MKTRPYALGAFLIAMVSTVLTVTTTTAAQAAPPPPKPGPVTGLQMTLTKPAENFTVNASWNAATGATTYNVSLTNATTGAALAANSVGTTSWSASVNLTGVTQVRLTVSGQNKRTGPAASITQAVPDLTAPLGTYAVSWVDRTGTITQTSLTDDGPIAQVTRSVNWGDGSAAEAWPTGDTISHLYAADGLYRPTVTLTDGAGNSRVVALAAIVPGDKTAPIGHFTTSPGKAWEKLTTVNVTQTALSDDFSPASYLLRWVNWGDGSAVQPWVDGISIGHVYAAAGTYTPKVLLKDEAGNTREVAAEAVSVEADTVLPLVKLTLPKKGVADEVSSWKKVAGVATDDKGTGVDSVAVLAIEKRATGWFFYKGTTKTWVKTTTKAKAWSRAKAAVADPTAKGVWVVKLAGLRKGKLFVKATATDLAGNVSKPVSHKAVLTAP